VEPITGGRRSENLGQVGLGLALAVTIEEQIPGRYVIRKLHHVSVSFGYADHMASCVITFERARKERRVGHAHS
jgi:hypothetical protein